MSNRCPYEEREHQRLADEKARREADQRCYDWQFATVSKQRAAEGKRPLTYSEWISGCDWDEEVGDATPPRSELARALRFFAALFLALVPMAIVGLLDKLGVHVGRVNAGAAMICSIMLLGFVACLARPLVPR